MKLRPSSLSRLVIAVVFLLASFASPAYAKKRGTEDERPPYDVPGLTNRRVWIPWVFAFVFTAGGIAIALKNPHRVSTERT
jgi:predicted cobalt transporter CbtA